MGTKTGAFYTLDINVPFDIPYEQLKSRPFSVL